MGVVPLGFDSGTHKTVPSTIGLHEDVVLVGANGGCKVGVEKHIVSGRSYLVPPCGPAVTRMTGEQLDSFTGRVHAFDELVERLRLLGVTSTR